MKLAILLAALLAATGKPPKGSGILEQVLAIERTPDKNEDKKSADAPGGEDDKSRKALYANCLDAKGIAVRWEENLKIADIAQALFDKKKRPTIQYNPHKGRFVREVSRQFFFTHECGHHALGHLYGGVQGVDKEQQADCYAIHRLKQDDKLHEGDLDAIQQDLSKLGRIDENHMAGVRRASNLKWCLSDPMPHAPEPKAEAKSETAK